MISRYLPLNSRALCFVTLAVSLTLQVQAAEDALVLPKGIFRARVVGVQTAEVQERYNADGKLEPFTAALNRSVTVSDLAVQEPKLAQLVQVLNTLQPGLGDDLMGSNLYADSRLSQRIVMPALEYGITSRLTAGLRVPIVTRDSRNSFRADGVNNSAAIARQLGTGVSPQVYQGVLSAGASSLDSAFFTNALFTSKGYEAPHDFHKTEPGDVETGLKYRFHQGKRYAAATQWGIRLPTGSTPSLNHVFDKGTGGGSFAAGLSLFQDVNLARNLVFGSMAKGMYFLPDTRARAVPRDERDTLPSLLPEDGQVQQVTRSPGLQFESELALTASLFDDKLSFWSAYQYAVHGEDRFAGPGSLDYRALSKETDWWKTGLELGTSLYTLPWYRAKKFPLPGRLNLIYNTTLAGTNTPRVNFIRTDLIVFF